MRKNTASSEMNKAKNTPTGMATGNRVHSTGKLKRRIQNNTLLLEFSGGHCCSMRN